MFSLFGVVLLTSPTRGEVSSDRIKRLDAYLLSEAGRFHLPGVAYAVVDGGEIAHLNVFGHGVTEDSAFIIGSCSKTVTALAALLALDENGVDLDTPINVLLTKVTIRSSAPPPTLRQLLQHRSGLTRHQGFDPLPSLAEVEAHGFSLDVKFPPGERYSYSNRNYSLLGLIIEKVTGQTFCDVVHERVFKPVGMTASSCGSVPSVSAAPEHQYCFGFPLRVEQTNAPASQLPSGFLRCSGRDLARLQICLLHDGMLDDKKVFPAKLVRQMKTPPDEAEFGYGMGLVSGYLDDLGPIIAHEGATPTSYAFHGALPEQESGIVLLININLFDPFTDHGETIYKNMLRILDGREPVTSHPYRIWVPWALIPVLLVTVWQAGVLLTRWKRAGWPFAWPTTPRQVFSLVLQVVLPVGIWFLVLSWVNVPFKEVLQLDPDVVWSFLFLTATGMATGVIKSCGGKAIQQRRRKVAGDKNTRRASSPTSKQLCRNLDKSQSF